MRHPNPLALCHEGSKILEIHEVPKILEIHEVPKILEIHEGSKNLEIHGHPKDSKYLESCLLPNNIATT